MNDIQQRLQALSLEKRKLLEMHLQKKEMGDKSVFSQIPLENGSFPAGYYPVSSAQKRLYLINLLGDTGIAYNVTSTTWIEGFPDRMRLKKAWESLIHRHTSLRTSFEILDGEPVQKIHQQLSWKIEYLEADKKEVHDLLRDLIQPFNLGSPPLFRVWLIKLSDNKHLLILDLHHIICDGISVGIIIQELAALYHGRELADLRIQYKDFAVWQNKRFNSGEFEQHENFWLQSLAGEIPVLNLPNDYPRPLLKSFTGDRLIVHSETELLTGLKAIGKASGATMHMVLLAAFALLLSRYSGQEDLVIGTPVAGRRHADLEDIVGMFVNTLAIRCYPQQEKLFARFLEETRDTLLSAYEHQDYQFETLVEKLGVQRDMGRNPLFDVMFVLQNMNPVELVSEELTFQPYEAPGVVARFDLTLQVVEVDQKLVFVYEFATALFLKQTIQRIAKHYMAILEQIIQSPTIKMSEIELLSPEEKQQLLVDFNRTGEDFPDEMLIHQFFEVHAERDPDHIALVFAGREWSYRELNHLANFRAGLLRAQGVGAGTIVGIMMERSLEMMVGILAVLKAGGAYLPLDPVYPPERLRFMLEDSGSGILLISGDMNREQVEHIGFAGKLLVIDRTTTSGESGNLTPVSTARDLAYLIYTSGSTGKPKGVMLEHQGLANLQQFFRKHLGIVASDRILQFASCSFDASVWEWVMALATGATLCPALAEEIRDPRRFEDFLNQCQITVATLPPSYLAGLNPERVQTLRKLITAGSAISHELCRLWATRLAYYNAYGPTETTICATIWPYCAEETERTVPIGKPLPNTRVFILDSQQRLLPVGVAGELCVGGEILARGYLGRPDLTAEKFMPDPFMGTDGIGPVGVGPFVDPVGANNVGANHDSPLRITRLYKTGDLARWLPDGNIEFLGRIDHQVKIRGFRIELGEVEAALVTYESIGEVVVVAVDEGMGNRILVAYYTGERELTFTELREHLSRSLPEYMIPSYFIRLEKIPLTENGKIDRKALPKSTGLTREKVQYVPPGNPVERIVARIWQDVLGIEEIGIHDNFFDLGGNSLRLIRVQDRLQQHFPGKATVTNLYLLPTIQKTAAFILEQEKTNIVESEAYDDPGETGEHPEVLTCSYYYTKNGKREELIGALSCFEQCIFLVMKNKYDIPSPAGIFFDDITVSLKQYRDGGVKDLGILSERRPQDYVYRTRMYKGKGRKAFAITESLLERGEVVILQTMVEKLPFLKYYNPEFESTAYEPGHMFLVLWHHEEYFYYVDNDIFLNHTYYQSSKMNKYVGVAPKKFFKEAFDRFFRCFTIKFDLRKLRDMEKINRSILAKMVSNYQKKAVHTGEFLESYGREAILQLIALCEKNLYLDSKIKDISLYELLKWKFSNITSRRQLLEYYWLEKDREEHAKTAMDAQNNWIALRELMEERYKKGCHFWDIHYRPLLEEVLVAEDGLVQAIGKDLKEGK